MTASAAARDFTAFPLPLTVDGAVITRTGQTLFVFDAESGDTLFKFDTAVDFETINGVGYGGSIDSHAIAAGSGMVFIGSDTGI